MSISNAAKTAGVTVHSAGWNLAKSFMDLWDEIDTCVSKNDFWKKKHEQTMKHL
jgi:hypothetical protein